MHGRMRLASVILILAIASLAFSALATAAGKAAADDSPPASVASSADKAPSADLPSPPPAAPAEKVSAEKRSRPAAVACGSSGQAHTCTRNWGEVVSSSDGTKFVATARNGYIYTYNLP